MKKFKNLKVMQIRVTRIVFLESKDVKGADYKTMMVYFNSANSGVGGFDNRDLVMSFNEATDNYQMFDKLPKVSQKDKNGRDTKVITAEMLMKATLPSTVKSTKKVPKVDDGSFDPDDPTTYDIVTEEIEKPALLDPMWLTWKTSLPRPKGDKFAIRDFIDEHPNEVPMRIAAATMQLSNEDATKWRLVDKEGKPVTRHIQGREIPIEETETTVCWQCTFGEVIDEETGRATGEFDFLWDADPGMVLDNIRKTRYQPVTKRATGSQEQADQAAKTTDDLMS